MKTLEGIHTPQVEEHWVSEAKYSDLERKYLHAVNEITVLKKKEDAR